MKTTNNIKNKTACACAALLVILLFGCSTKKGVVKESAFQKWRLLAEKSKGHSPTAAPRIIDLPEVIKQQISRENVQKKQIFEKPLPSQNVTLKMRDADIGVVIRALARAANQNILINSDVQGKITINIIDTPWSQAFNSILKAQKLFYKREGDIVRILTLDDMEHDLKMGEMQAKQMSINKDISAVEPRFTEVIPIYYADATKIRENIAILLGGGGEQKTSRGEVMVDEHTNALIIQAGRDDLVKIIPLINELDRPIAQILIEAHIVETNRDTARNLGIQWRETSSAADSPTRDIGLNLAADNLEGVGPGSLGLVFGKIGDSILDIQLSALQKSGELNILSSPSITTLDNQTAFTESGTRIPVSTESTTGGAVTQEVAYVDAVLRLEITPHVIDGENLKMKISIKKDEVDESRNVNGNPFIIKKQTETNLIVKNKETIVISGLTKEIKSESSKGLPWLMEAPALSWLFKSENRKSTMEEVLIFITPTILRKQLLELK